MKLKSIKANMTELILENRRILFGYRTPVACFDIGEGVFYRTKKKWSQTTTRHINRWLAGNCAYDMEQAYFDSIGAEVK